MRVTGDSEARAGYPSRRPSGASPVTRTCTTHGGAHNHMHPARARAERGRPVTSSAQAAAAAAGRPLAAAGLARAAGLTAECPRADSDEPASEELWFYRRALVPGGRLPEQL